MTDVQIVKGDVREVLRGMTDGSVDAVFADPPYGLEFMGKDWDAPWKEVANANDGFRRAENDADAGRASVHGRMSRRGPEYKAGVGFQRWVEEWAGDLLRVMRPGAPALMFGGTRTFHRLTAGLEDAGLEIRDCLSWLYGSGFPKSLNVSKAIDKSAGAERPVVGSRKLTGTARIIGGQGGASSGKSESMYETHETRDVLELTAPATEDAKRWDGWGTALKPAWEPCVLARKPLDGTVASNALAHGCGPLAIDACRIEWRGPEDAAAAAAAAAAVGFQTSRLRGTATQSVSVGKESRDGTEVYDPSQVAGRWPANVLLDEEAAAQLDAQSGERKSGIAVTRNGGGGKVFAGLTGSGLAGYAGRPRPDSGYADSGGASRYFYCAKASKKDRGGGNTHPCCKPTKLTEYLARLLLPPPRTDGQPRTILVPFSGSGSEMIGAVRAGWDRVIGIERESAYVAIAERRLAAEREGKAAA